MKFPDLSSITASAPMRLRDLIRQIRSAKTAAEERAVVQKECANIRDSFRDENNTWRCRNVAKLLYVSLLGYPAHFGQLECLKLIASTRFTDKRIGYLGAMLLLDERQDIHVLITHSLKTDLNNTNQYIAGLALCALAVICSPAMSRDLANEVEKLMRSSNAYLKKKAILCAVRIVRKVPEQIDLYKSSVRNLLTDKNHGILLATTVLMRAICEQSPEALQSFRKLVPNIVRILRILITSGYSADHDVAGISDPFLQVHLLRVLRTLGRNDPDVSESMNDILTQVATNTESSKNVGSAILYEAALTIMEIKSESGLRILAVNILGRFLSNNDKNIRYVALNTLLKMVHADYSAVQRHRETIVDCLKDPDTSIKRRAMELCFTLINANNIRPMSKELLAFLANCETEFKADCTSNMFLAMERFAPSKIWHVDKMIQVLKTAGNNVRDDIVSSLIGIISSSSELHAHAAHQLYDIINGDITQQPLVQVAAWTLGEYGDLFIHEQYQRNKDQNQSRVSENDIVTVLENILNWSISSVVTREYAINALMKLSTRFPNCSDRIQSVMTIYACNMNLELQTRAIEYTSLFTRYNTIRPSIVERMPILINPSSIQDNSQNTNAYENNYEDSDSIREMTKRTDQTSEPEVDLLGILDIPVPTVNTNGLNVGQSLIDVIGDDQPNLGIYSATKTNNQPSHKVIPPMTVFHKNGLHIVFEFERQDAMLTIQMQVTNSRPSPMTNFVFKAAVPKTFQIELQPSSTNVIPGNRSSAMHQKVIIHNVNRDKLRMRIKINYSIDNSLVSEDIELNEFPEQCYN